MTIFDLTQAFKRYWKTAAIAFAVLVLGILIMTFTIADGKPTFRAGLKYDSSVQIAVVAPGTESLVSSAEGVGNLVNAASLYASLLGSDEAAEWIGEQNGYRLESAVNATTERDSTVIVAQVTGPSPEQATGAALSTFDWLGKRLREPIETAGFQSPPTTAAPVVLDGPFVSFVDVGVDSGLAGVPEDLFLFIDAGEDSPIALPLAQSAESIVRTRAVLEPLTTVVFSLATASGEVLDTIRLAPDPTPQLVDAVPELVIGMGDGSVRETSLVTADDTETAWNLVGSEITIEWREGVVAAAAAASVTTDVDLALLTPVPGFTASGGRRGPIIAVAGLLIGSVLIVTAIIVADTWSRERDARETPHTQPAPSQQPEQPSASPTQAGESEGVSVGAEAKNQPASLDQ